MPKTKPIVLRPQFDSVTGETFYLAEEGGGVFSSERARDLLERGEAVLDLGMDEGAEASKPSEEDEEALRRQERFRRAADAVAAEWANLPALRKVVLFGSVARPLPLDEPGPRTPRRYRYPQLHWCKDVDLAVWLDDLAQLRSLQRGLARALASHDSRVATHQVDVFVMETGSDRYLGRLCIFGTCPKGKLDCQVPRCGATPHLQRHENFPFDWGKPSVGSIVLYERGPTAPST